jgi:chemotaxis protein MotB
MHNPWAKLFLGTLLLTFIVTSSGCTLIFGRSNRKNTNERYDQLKSEYVRLQDELSELERAKRELEDRLAKEIGDKQVSVQMTDKGLVVTFLAEVLFDSGKADLRPESYDKLGRVAGVIQTTVRDLNVGIEGHTDNDPIRYSGWKSNWELSAHRALSVLHYFIDEHGVVPSRLSAIGYGEYQPLATNETREGKQQNRRVEIVFLPKTTKAPAQISPASQQDYK